MERQPLNQTIRKIHNLKDPQKWGIKKIEKSCEIDGWLDAVPKAPMEWILWLQKVL